MNYTLSEVISIAHSYKRGFINLRFCEISEKIRGLSLERKDTGLFWKVL
jgi:hypothetical protein